MKQFYNFLSPVKKRNHILRNAVTGMAILLSGGTIMNAQVSAYSFAQSTGNFTNLTSGTVLETAAANSGASSLYNVSYPVTMPFSFNFNGTLYSNLTVSSNGYITFAGTDPSTVTTPISGTSDWDGSISAWGRSLNSMFNISGTTGDIRWETVGTAPNREMVIQWTNFRPSYSTSTTNVYAFSFQIRLKETSNQIITTYNSGSYLLGSSAIASTAQIGLRGKINTDFNNRLNASTLAFTSSAPGTAATSTQYYSTSATAASGMPPSGFTYTWTPPACFAPVLTSTSTTANSITADWAAPSPAPSTYDVYLSTTNTAPTSATTPTQSNISGTSATLNLLTESTPYYIWVRSNCGTGSAGSWSVEPILAVTKCQPSALLSTAGETVCAGNTATLTASTEAGASIKWYDNSVGGSALTTANSYTTPPLYNTTNYWVSSAKVQNAVGGKITPVSVTGNTGTGIGLTIDAFKDFVINTIDVYPYTTTAANAGAGAGTVTVNLVNSAGTIVQTNTYTVNVTHTAAAAAAAPPTTITLNYAVPAGLGYKLLISAKSSTVSGFIRESDDANFSFPYFISDICSLGTTTSGYYYYIYNLNLTSACESPRTMVTATVGAAGCLSTSETEKQEAIKVYPNPFSDVINVTRPELVKAINVSDNSGRLLITIKQPESTLRLQNLSAGLYILQLDMKDGSKQSIKIFKR